MNRDWIGRNGEYLATYAMVLAFVIWAVSR